jgi:predicted DNA-binding protein YlxM (UPF0122 family)
MDTQVVDEYDDVSNFYAIEEDGYERTNNSMVISKIIKNLKTLIPDKTERLVFFEVIKSDFDKSQYKEIAKNYEIKLKQVYEIIEKCQQIMKEHKSDFI